jgi:hypothetical protein
VCLSLERCLLLLDFYFFPLIVEHLGWDSFGLVEVSSGLHSSLAAEITVCIFVAFSGIDTSKPLCLCLCLSVSVSLKLSFWHSCVLV